MVSDSIAQPTSNLYRMSASGSIQAKVTFQDYLLKETFSEYLIISFMINFRHTEIGMYKLMISGFTDKKIRIEHAQHVGLRYTVVRNL